MRALRIAGHPAHAMLVHFPLAFWAAVFPLEAAGAFLGWDAGWRLAFWVNALAIAFAVPTAGAGLIDFVGLRGTAAAETAGRHLMVMLTALAAFFADLLMGLGRSTPDGGAAWVRLALTLGGALLLLWGGWLGGELVFRHGAGRKDEAR
jgi:uncharacterized membrane protein